MDEKLAALDACLRRLGRTLVAYSGGVDSAFLAWRAHQVLGTGMLAVIADSPSLARAQLEDALAFAGDYGFPVEVVPTGELENPDYARNDAQRCFFCKDELFTVMERLRSERGYNSVAYGVNADDQGDFRPGQNAARAHGVAAPLLDAGFTKQDVRNAARSAGLRVWDKPASACLASRIEYGRPVTPEALSAVERGEDELRALGFRQFRVRHHGAVARIEIARQELDRALVPAMREHIAAAIKRCGFTYVAVDLEGFRSGSMNAVLPAQALARK